MKKHDCERTNQGRKPRSQKLGTVANRSTQETANEATGADKVAPKTWIAWRWNGRGRIYLRAKKAPKLTAKFMSRQEALAAVLP